jgi:enamine deaminase RidA (YjgF/YER057c/UK114 family)
VILPNDMVRQFDRLLGTVEQQNDFVVFLSGQQGLDRAVEKDLASFRHSWRHKALF